MVRNVYDVIVVGGGPVGSHCASILAAAGHRVAVLEQKLSPADDVCCTGIVSEQCVAEFSIDPSVVFRHESAADVFSPSGQRLNLYKPAPQAAILDRPAFNLMMSARAERSGAEYRRGARVTVLRPGADGVEVVFEERQSKREAQARVVVLATGWNQALQKSVGISESKRFVAGAQTEVNTSVEHVEVFTGRDTSPGFFGWLVPTTANRGLAGVLAERDPQQRLSSLVRQLKGSGRVRSAESGVSSSPLPLSPVTRTSAERIVVVGTSAGLVKPTTGGGIYFGLLSAGFAADVIGQGLVVNDLSAAFLQRYDALWKRSLEGELRLGMRARWAFERLSDRRIDGLIDTMSTTGVAGRLLSSKDFSFDWHGKMIRNLLQVSNLAKILRGVALPPGRGRHSSNESQGDTD